MPDETPISPQAAFSQPNWQPQTVIQNYYSAPPEQWRQDAAQTDRGLTALASLIQAPEVRAAVVAFRTDLQAAGQQIELLACLKELHDHLHNVEFRCYRIIQQDAARFPADELAVESLADNQLTLHDLVEKVQSATQRPVLQGEETGWSVDLTEADRALGEAVNLRDAGLLRRCVQLLKRLLTREPSRINERLNRTAGMLRLGQIENALAGIAQRLVGAQTEGGWTASGWPSSARACRRWAVCAPAWPRRWRATATGRAWMWSCAEWTPCWYTIWTI